MTKSEGFTRIDSRQRHGRPLARFGRVLQRIDTAADVDWADLAVSTGYFDRPHFIGD